MLFFFMEGPRGGSWLGRQFFPYGYVVLRMMGQCWIEKERKSYEGAKYANLYESDSTRKFWIGKERKGYKAAKYANLCESDLTKYVYVGKKLSVGTCSGR